MNWNEEVEMTDKITLELTLDELKTLDKYVEYNDETQSVFDKIKDAYPQLKMTLENEGEYAIVSYNDTTYYRLMGETTFTWYIKKGVSANYPVPTLVMVTDGETERLLEGLYYNDIVVKKEKEQRQKESETLYDLIADWWDEIFMNNNEAAVTIESLVDDIEKWLPKPQSAAGSQNSYVECSVEGFNDCLTKIKGKLR